MAKKRSSKTLLGSLLSKHFSHSVARVRKQKLSPKKIKASTVERRLYQLIQKSLVTRNRIVESSDIPALPLSIALPDIQNIPPALVPAPALLAPSVQSQSLTTDDLKKPGDALRESIEGFLLDQRSPHTRRAYAKDLKRFVQYLHGRGFAQGANKKIESLDRTVIIGYKDQLLSEKLEHTTVDRHLATLRSFFRWLCDDGLILKNPAEGVRFLNPKKISRTVGFTDQEVVKILKCPDLHTRTGAQHYAILMVLFYCGLRRSELCDLTFSSLGVERAHRVLKLRGKGNVERILAIPEATWNALEYYLRITGKDLSGSGFGKTADTPLFSPIRNNRTGNREKPLDPSMIFYIVTKYARQAGIQNRVSPHSCRATAISNARDHQVPDRVIQEFAGWASPDMITRYDKRRVSVEKSASKAIEYGAEDRTPKKEVL